MASLTAIVAAISAVDTVEGQREADSVSAIKESFHIETLLNYLPIIVLVVIILIGIVTSDLLKDNASIFATLVIVFTWIVFIHYFSPSKYHELEKETLPRSTFLPKPVNFPNTIEIYKYVIVAVIFVLGLGFGFGSIKESRSAKDYNPSLGLMIVGGLLISVGVISIVWNVIKNNSITEWIHYVILLIVIGIPLVVRGSEINDNLKSDKLTEDSYNMAEYQKTIANTSAEWMLGIGVFFQIVVFMAAGYWLWGYISDTDSANFKIKLGIIAFIMCVIFMPGGIFLSKSLGLDGSGFGTDKNKKLIDTEPFEYKAFMVHAIIYLIVGVIFLIILFGQTEKFTVLNNVGGILSVMVIFTIIAAASVQQANNDKSQNSTAGIMWSFSLISLIIVVSIWFFWTRRLTLFSDNSPINDTEIKKKIKYDAMLSDDWDKLLIKATTNIDPTSTTIRLAKWFSLTPFLSVILLILWVSILFTNVTTSPTTTNWIGNKFSGDMFPRVKELIDTFFIVIIVGLSLCAILLLPVVKEMNVGGLESILKFAESIQVWQFNTNNSNPTQGKWVGLFIFLAVGIICLSWWWDYLARIKPEEEKTTGVSLPIVPDNWGWAIGFVVLLAICSIPTGYHIFSHGINADFAKENVLKQILRQILTTIYLVPLLIVVLFRAGIYGVASLTGIDSIIKKRNDTIDTLKFWEWDPEITDLRMFPTTPEDRPTPNSVTSVLSDTTATPPTTAPPTAAPPTTAPAETDDTKPASINETKVSAIGKLIKVILLTISFVILILAVIYYVYKIDAEFVNKSSSGADGTASGGFAAQMNSPTAHAIYVIMSIVAVAGVVAYIREKFTKANSKTPENYLFDDLKTEDATNPLRQLAFGATHIMYVILMVIVWIYDRDVDDKNKMSITGMTVLGLAILFFHYGLEFIDTLNPEKIVSQGTEKPKPSVADIFTNIRFIINTVFFIILCALAYYKQHGVMVVLILAMFIFHLTKSAIGIKVLHLLWLCIIYIPCLFLDLLQSSQSTVGDTTRPIWIIVAIELLLIAILYGGPYLLNYIGASASQIVAAPVTLKDKYDTKLNTQSPQIFIYHNTGIDRTPEDKAANCPVEEKKRYNYSISGWFFLNNNVTSTDKDLEIFNFGDVPKLTYNPSTAELKLLCNTLDMGGNPKKDADLIYNSKANYNKIISVRTTDHNPQWHLKMLLDNDEELDAPIPLQRWNYFVVNYNGKTMDFFLNTKLVVRSDFIMPDIQLKPITVGDIKGLNGTICNFAFHTTPLTKEQMRWTYNMLKSQNPPMIGTTTIEDDVKAAGSTTVYSK